MEPMFVKDRLKVGSVDALTEQALDTYAPPYHDSHARPFCCMLNHKHSYVVKYDLNSLEQKHNDAGDNSRAYDSEYFYIKNEKKMTTNFVKRRIV